MEIASISLCKQNVLRWFSAAGLWLRASQSFERQRNSSSYLAYIFVFLLIKIALPFKKKLSTEIIFLLFGSMLFWVKKVLKQQVIDYSEHSFQGLFKEKSYSAIQKQTVKLYSSDCMYLQWSQKVQTSLFNSDNHLQETEKNI